MEIKELVSFFINESSETLEITFRLTIDGEDEIRTDQIQISETQSFGYNFEEFKISPLRDLFEEDEDEDGFENIFDDDFEDPLDEDEIMSFLNEYYLIYPNKLPTAEFF
jgi:hypothetical protein